ncbi:MAG: hypothetical protein J4432_03240 [DPANN group archaeon]|nr:hypothetical protein [DPANN group archaeon]
MEYVVGKNTWDFYEIESLTRTFEKFGLRRYESNALALVCKSGECTAQDLSEYGVIPITKTYQVLYGLQDKDLLSSTLQRPKRFSAKLDEVLDKLLSKKRDTVRQYESEAEKARQVVVQVQAV